MVADEEELVFCFIWYLSISVDHIEGAGSGMGCGILLRGLGIVCFWGRERILASGYNGVVLEVRTLRGLQVAVRSGIFRG
jgi:hypothetical protein